MNRSISYNLQQIWSLKVQGFLFFFVCVCFQVLSSSAADAIICSAALDFSEL